MDNIEIVKTCPLGSECREIKDNKMYVCRWMVKMKGTDAAGEKHDSEECALYWMPILTIEASTTNRSIAAAIESSRNVNDINQRQANAILNERLRGIN